MKKITIPYKPRYPEVHEKLEAARFSVIVAHRRFGKTVLSLNHMIKSALLLDKPMGRFAFIAPFLKQAKEATWDYLKFYTAPIPNRKVDESELSIRLPNNGHTSKIRIFGADTPDSLRGAYYDGVVLDEVAQMKPEVWGEVIRPMLADRKGWALFIGTPKGINLFSEQYYKACKWQAEGDSEWYAQSFPVTETNALSPQELEKMRGEISENAWRQEMLCDFSASSDDVLIPMSLVAEAAGRHIATADYAFSPVVLGVDVARFGDDASVIFPRQGLLAYPPVVIRGADNMALADRIVFEKQSRDARAIFIDAGGGSGVIDRLRQLGHEVVEVPFGGSASRPDRYKNRRMEMWARMGEWLKSGGSIPADELLKAELSAPTYGYDSRGVMQLEAKDAIKERLTRSPDRADALALTFAMPVAANLGQPAPRREYDPLAW